MKNILHNVTWFNWNPTKDLVAVMMSWFLVVASLSIATFVVTGHNGVGYFLVYAILTALFCGIGFPVLWMVFIKKQPLSSLGISKTNIKQSLIIQLVLTGFLYLTAFSKINLPPYEHLLPLISLALAIGFFEAVFWRGWIFIRLEEAFGLVPALLLGSLLYALYHIGYGMPVPEMIFLFFIGLMFAIVFRFTKNIFILWPLFQPMGQLVNLMKENLPLPMIASLGFIEVLAAMIFIVLVSPKIARKLQRKK